LKKQCDRGRWSMPKPSPAIF